MTLRSIRGQPINVKRPEGLLNWTYPSSSKEQHGQYSATIWDEKRSLAVCCWHGLQERFNSREDYSDQQQLVFKSQPLFSSLLNFSDGGMQVIF